ncbi:MAG TPA: NAD(P)H-hydrate dehydratase [Planctomycetota bacterium]|jgi:NAD(P)H-hydrate epimerase|nr:NAD(P)H-hydrate dehydratase [Planctomycetota bacterium]OQC19468.1 MAG: Bifunctional NAD(P)H-hydrate repair enzyme Nnr [Planctomycetes bacterium ADurb.Bin069]NMD36048.1 NAD(P)H-hydrate dehydratase [Planctomycetota bacterium]HNR99707.1 NAD(P)H-hydrate dehydratase [Planctomycetota bacterium]HNU25326.1 NAD(P)H-hydrate dehydratase [Planctomycetota bacterium]
MIAITAVPAIPPRERDSHKGTYGHVLVIGGSLGMTGAPVMACEAALRAGAGLVTCACPVHVAAIVAAKLTEAMTFPLPADARGCFNAEALRIMLAAAERFDAFVIGPGLDPQAAARDFVRALVDGVRRPFVVDAGALRAFDRERPLPAHCVATPHPGEFALLTGAPAAAVQRDRRAAAERFMQSNDGVLVLKGSGTIVCAKDRFYVNTTGNPGMATGGAGDVLAGVLGALLAQGWDPFQAAVLGVWLHGRAGDLACEELGEESLIAGDITRHLAAAIRERKTSSGGRT